MSNPVEVWKAQKHGFDVWPEVVRHAAAGTPQRDIDPADLERMKWYGFFYRKRDEPGRYMSRIRITAGELSAPQAKEVARLAYELGHGIVDVTTRANLQIQGLEIKHLPEVRQRLEAVGLTARQTGHDNVRNVFGHPFSGLMPGELYDTRQLCHEITGLFLDSREYADLPRKLNICLSGTAEHSVHFWTQDLSFLATRTPAGEVAFWVLIGGTQGQNPQLARQLPALVAPNEVLPVAQGILDLFRRHGSREKRGAARFRYLVDALGPDGVLAWLDERLPAPLRRCADQAVCAASDDELVGWFPQAREGWWTMGLSVPLGRLTWQQLEGLGVLAARWGDGWLRTTHQQGLAVINLPAAAKGPALTDAAALGLSIYADSLDRNALACTGSQFCNIAVTETKGQMFRLMERLRKRPVRLDGIRIHMSGCPSSCAQHFTADIGLKGVRVRRLLGTREGFDVYLGGGIAGEVRLGRVYRLGVDPDQLPALIEEVVGAYYLRHRPGQTFSDYWREVLPEDSSEKAADGDFHQPQWLCEKCQYLHAGVDPPIFCPNCAGLRRNFARLDESGGAGSGGPPGAAAAPAAEAVATHQPQAAAGSQADAGASASAAARGAEAGGFVYAADESQVPQQAGLEVEVDGKPLALFRAAGAIHAVDALCPHEGAPLAQGDYCHGVVTCPWHGWTFNASSGASLAPAGHDLAHYDTRVVDGRVLVRLAGDSAAEAPPTAAQPSHCAAHCTARTAARPAAPSEALLPLAEIRDEAADVKTFRFDNRGGLLLLDHPGRFVRIGVPIEGQFVWRSFTISSSPARPEWLDLTVKLNPLGTVSRHLFAEARAGQAFRLKGPQGGFFFDPARHIEPLVLVSAGSGITPMISIVRLLADRQLRLPCTFVYGARTRADVLFERECRALAAARSEFRYAVALSRPDPQWTGLSGRLDCGTLLALVDCPVECRYFLCGPDSFREHFLSGLAAAGVPAEQVHTEAFHSFQPLPA